MEGDTASSRITYVYRGKRGEEIPSGVTHLLVDTSVKKIAIYKFQNCLSLVQISLPANVRMIGTAAFSGCKSLQVVELCEGLKVIDKDAFAHCKSLRRISIPRSCSYLCTNSFWRCQNLSVVELQYGLKEIEAGGFSSCKSLTRISIPETMNHIAFGTFQYCDNLVDVELAIGLQAIGERAFWNCRSLCALSIPSTTKFIARDAFCGCNELLGIELSDHEPLDRFDDLQYSFNGTPSLVNIYVPSNAYPKDKCSPFDGCSALDVYDQTDIPNDVISRLQDRFRGLPIHKECYHASTTDSVCLARLLEKRTTNEERSRKDDYGMTPFHIIATSAKLRTDLLDVILLWYPFETLAHKDVHGKTMLDYLFVHRSPKAIPLIKVLIETVILKKTRELGLEKWDTELESVATSLDWNGELEVRRTCLGKILAKVGYCVKMEAAFLLELALWKRNIRPNSDSMSPRKKNKLDREHCRMTSGAEVAIPFVIAFLSNSKAAESDDISMVPQNLAWMRDQIE